MKKLLIIFMILFILLGDFNVDILGRSIKDIQARMTGQVNYRINVVKGIVESENINKTYNCYIAGETVIYPNIPTFSRKPKLQPGDKVTIEFINGCRETPAILAPEDIRERPDITFRCTGDVDTAVYDGVSFDMDSEDIQAQGIHISPDGTRMYIVGRRQNKVFQYSLSNPWDLSTASYDGKFFDVSSEDTSLYGLFFSPDGTKMYIIGYVNDSVFQYTLATAWDVSTALYGGKFFDVSVEASAPRHLFFKLDGNRMYVTDEHLDRVFQYSLSTAWDVSTATYDSKYADVNSEEHNLYDVFFTTYGNKMYIIGHWDIVFQYTLGIPWDISTASYDGKSFDTSYVCNWARALFFKHTNCKMYIVTSTPSVIYQYSLDR